MRRFSNVLGVAVVLLAAVAGRASASDPAGKTNSLKKGGHYTEAAKVYTAALSADAKDAASRNALAWIQAACPDAACRDGKSAVANATKACEATDWKDHDYLDTLAAAYAEQGDFENATLWEGLAVELAPAASKKDFTARLDLYKQQQPFREDSETLPATQDALPAPLAYRSIEECSSVIASHPDDVRAYSRRGQLWFERKEYDKAAADYTRAIELEPNRPAHRRGRAVIRREQGRLDDALADYSAALKIAPANPLFLTERAAVYKAKGDLAKANADEAASHVARAMKHVADQQFADAIRDYEEAIKLAPSSPRAYNQLAWLRATCPITEFRDGKAAVESATRACDLTAYKSDLYLDTLAAACAESGDFDQAVNWEYLATELAPAARKAMFKDHLERFQKRQPYRDNAKP
jgi:tetratricopeptide (TPR) repeat protein